MTIYVIMETRLDDTGNVVSSEPLTATVSKKKAKKLVSDARRMNTNNVRLLHTDPCIYRTVCINTMD